MSLTFLSEEWFEALRDQLQAGPASPGAETAVRVGQLVTGVPAGPERSWTLVLQAGAVPVLEVGSVADADVVLVESYDAAWALASGSASAGQLLEAGEVKIRGDARRLVAASEMLEAVAAASGALSRVTTRDEKSKA